ncbi:MAG: FAD-binding protein [Firmicutes bacterium]|nr:FAD-binding protein [Bacillota bacterium]
MGGLLIDEYARAFDRDQKPIEGLLSAGEVTGEIHGACRLGSCEIAECLAISRIVGKTAILINHD